MSQLPPPPPPSPQPLNGCVVALLIVIGIVLLLPGLCALLMIGFDPAHTLNSRQGVMTCLGLLAVAIGGIVIIRLAVRRR